MSEHFHPDDIPCNQGWRCWDGERTSQEAPSDCPNCEREEARADAIAVENEKLAKALRAMLGVLEREGIVDMGLFDRTVRVARAALTIKASAERSDAPEGLEMMRERQSKGGRLRRDSLTKNGGDT